MDIKDRAAIIEQFSKMFTIGEIERDFFTDFVIYNDLGIPLSQVVVYDLGTLNQDGINVLNETWTNLCEVLELDPEDEYDDFDEMLDLFEEDIDD